GDVDVRGSFGRKSLFPDHLHPAFFPIDRNDLGQCRSSFSVEDPDPITGFRSKNGCGMMRFFFGKKKSSFCDRWGIEMVHDHGTCFFLSINRKMKSEEIKSTRKMQVEVSG